MMTGTSSTTDTRGTALGPADVRTLLDEVRESFNAKDVEAFGALMQPDVEFDHVAAPAPLRGLEAVRAFYAEGVWLAFSDMRLELVDGPFLHPDAPHLMVAWQFSGTHTGRIDPPGLDPTGREVSILLHERWHVRDGRIAAAVVMFDVAEMMRQLGVLPDTGSRGEALLSTTHNLRVRLARLVGRD